MAYDNVEAVISALDEFKPTGNEPEDLCRLYDIFRNFQSLKSRERVVAAMFALLERYPDVELGSPGPIVHELEAIAGFEASLKASLSRFPTTTTVSMINRIMNSAIDDEAWFTWMQELQNALSHPLGDEDVRQHARYYIEYQTKRIVT